MQLLKAQLEAPSADGDVPTALNFQSLAAGTKRNTAAGCFYQLLVLKQFDRVDVKQQESYGPIMISRGPNFHEPVPQGEWFEWFAEDESQGSYV